MLLHATDIHLDHLNRNSSLFSTRKIKQFCDELNATEANWIVITGDLSNGIDLPMHLSFLEKWVEKQVYFVLGNHDFYGSSINEVRGKTARYNHSKLVWLNTQEVVELTPDCALVGHDGWYDGGYSDWFQSKLIMNEYRLVKDFRNKSELNMFRLIQHLAQEGADHIKTNLIKAARQYKYVVCATHVPAFRDNSRAPDGSLSDTDWLPCMSNKKLGDALIDVAKQFPETKFTCLSGHTHTKWSQTYLPNLREITGKSKYGTPTISFDLVDWMF